MNPPTSMHSIEKWKVLYRAAILEKNKDIVPQRVSQAEDAVVARVRELFYKPATKEERDELEDALYALRAYRSSWEHLKAA
ncbi:MAG TPA: hypothetical protein VMT53_28080 [Terriglobales bacterium]|nr:hypothetical protein [Terriglobales bacterium]